MPHLMHANKYAILVPTTFTYLNGCSVLTTLLVVLSYIDGTHSSYCNCNPHPNRSSLFTHYKIMKYIIPLLLLISCSSPVPPDETFLHQVWCLDVADNNIPAVQAAMDEWNDRTMRTTWTIGENCTAHIVQTDKLETDLQDKVAVTAASREEIQFLSGFDSNVNHIMLHELGHVAGLNHSNNENDIMFHSSFTPVEHLSVGDLKAFNDLYWKL